MKVLFYTRKNLHENPAGDTSIIRALKEYLRKLEIKVDLCTDNRVNLNSYDLIHLFNVSRATELYDFIKILSTGSKAVVLTPIYWDLNNYLKQINQKEKLDAWTNGERKRHYIFENIDLSILHSEGEAEMIKQNYNYNKPYQIIHYGTRPIKKEAYNYVKNRYGFEHYVLCVGRICPQKNQLSLIRALKNDSIPIVFVGNINDVIYHKACIAEAKQNTVFIDKMQNHQLDNLYQHAHVHILPSWVEYPGLASLEAGVAGCNVVSTENGSAKEIFGDMIDYCDPSNLENIRTSTLKALTMPKNDLLKNYILEHYTWDKHASKLQAQYKHLLQLKKEQNCINR